MYKEEGQNYDDVEANISNIAGRLQNYRKYGNKTSGTQFHKKGFEWISMDYYYYMLL